MCAGTGQNPYHWRYFYFRSRFVLLLDSFVSQPVLSEQNVEVRTIEDEGKCTQA